jgi:hypothetical protein
LATNFISRWCTKLQQSSALTFSFIGIRPCILYADDLLFIVKPTVQNIQVIKILLKFWEIISGLIVNLRKSEIATVIETDDNTARWAEILSCRVATFPMKYLGLPLLFKNLSLLDYLPLFDKYNAKLTGWGAIVLSPAGRLVMLNSVLTALPVYYMSVFKIQSWIIKKFDKIRRDFFWQKRRAL